MEKLEDPKSLGHEFIANWNTNKDEMLSLLFDAGSKAMEGDWFTFGNNLGVVNRVLLFGNDAVGNAFSDGIKGWLDGFFKIDHISDAVECLDQSAFIGQLS